MDLDFIDDCDTVEWIWKDHTRIHEAGPVGRWWMEGQNETSSAGGGLQGLQKKPNIQVEMYGGRC